MVDDHVLARMFRRSPIRWMTCPISYESHPRGQIMLALKRNGMGMPEKSAIQKVWEAWISRNIPNDND
jgi:hypothetical protein